MIPPVDLTPALLKAMFEPKRSGFESRFTPGETLQGFVEKSLGPSAAIVRLRGIEMTANTPRPLSAGQPITVKVEQVTPQFIVSLLPQDTPAKEKTAALLRLYLPSAAPISSTLEDLTALLETLPGAALRGTGLEKVMDDLQKAITKPAPEKNILRLLGLFHESEIVNGKQHENLKKSLLAARGNLERLLEKHPADYRDALKKVNDALANIELRQLMNAADGREIKSWQIPYWNGEAVDTARLYVERDEAGNKKGKNDETVRLTLVLWMSRLGDIRAEALAFRDRIEGTIYVTSDAAVIEIEKKMKDLTDALAGHGFAANIFAEKAGSEFIMRQLEPENTVPPRTLLNIRV